MQAISVKAVSEVLPSGTAGSCAEAEAGTILKHQIETRDPQVTHRVMSPLLEVRKSTRAIVL